MSLLQRKGLVACGLTLFLLGSPIDLEPIEDPHPQYLYQAPEIYKTWYHEMLACSGRQQPWAPLDSIDFAYVKGEYLRMVSFTPFMFSATVAETRWHEIRPHHVMIVTTHNRIWEKNTIQHEMLHAIISPEYGHPFQPGTSPCAVWDTLGYSL